MATYYSEFNRREHYDQPQVTRINHRYRGPRESEKINLEIHQFLFDVTKLYQKYDNLWLNFQTYANTLVDGGEVTGVTDSADDQVTLDGTTGIARRIQELTKRIEMLER